MPEYNEPLESGPCYKVFREIFVMKDSGINQNKLSQKMDMSLSQIRDAKRSLIREDLIEKVDGPGRSKLLMPNNIKLYKLCNDFFVDITKKSFPESFVKEYVKVYCHYNQRSTIRDMLFEDLAVSIKSYCKENKVEDLWLKTVCDNLQNNAPEILPSSKYIEEALNDGDF